MNQNPSEQWWSDRKIKRTTLFTFSIFILMMAGVIMGWLWLKQQPLDFGKSKGVQKPLRVVLNANEDAFSQTLSNDHLAKTYSLAKAAKKVRVNGNIGLNGDMDEKSWNLQLVKASGDTLHITLSDIKRLPKTEIVFDFKCIEGWSQITHWGGVRFSDFVKAYGLDQQSHEKYVGLVTPDSAYYVGIDMKSALHPQTLLCYEMNGKPLPMNQGYPLRLIIPVKYGIKSLKRIGTLFFSNKRPRDYWYERGYDYYSGL